MGSVLSASPGVVLLDVGNRLGPGAMDQHQDGSVGQSTADLVLRYPQHVYDHLLPGGPGLPSQQRCALVTHARPDFDGVVAALLCVLLVETGGFPSWAAGLAEYASIVDQGAWDVSCGPGQHAVTHPLHMGLSLIHI